MREDREHFGSRRRGEIDGIADDDRGHDFLRPALLARVVGRAQPHAATEHQREQDAGRIASTEAAGCYDGVDAPASQRRSYAMATRTRRSSSSPPTRSKARSTRARCRAAIARGFCAYGPRPRFARVRWPTAAKERSTRCSSRGGDRPHEVHRRGRASTRRRIRNRRATRRHDRGHRGRRGRRHHRSPMAWRSTVAARATQGIGELMRALLDLGLRRFMIGLGGSSTNDGGAGMLVALGLSSLDAAGADSSPRRPGSPRSRGSTQRFSIRGSRVHDHDHVRRQQPALRRARRDGDLRSAKGRRAPPTSRSIDAGSRATRRSRARVGASAAASRAREPPADSASRCSSSAARSAPAPKSSRT